MGACAMRPVIPFPSKITVKLVETNFLTRWPCHVCGSCTEKVAILAEAENGLRVCESCLRAGDIDARLERHAAALEAEAAEVRKLIGRLVVPTYAEWQGAVVDYDREMMRAIGMSDADILQAEANR